MGEIVIDDCFFMEVVRYKRPDGGRAIAEAEFMCKMLRSPHAVFVNDVIVDKFHDNEKKINVAGHPKDCNNVICRDFFATL